MPRGRTPVIISIATIPSRVGLMRPTLESLLHGDLVPDQILVVMPEFCVRENSGYDIPDFFADEAFCRSIVRPVHSKFDWGPGNKILGALNQIPSECFLVIADDDVRYSPRFLSALVRAQEENLDQSFSYYTYRICGFTVGQGCDGFSFWSRNLQGIWDFADRFVRDTSLIYHDDLWISFFLFTRGISIRSLQPLLDGNLVYEQLLDNNVLASMTGQFTRDVIANTHIPRLLKEVGLPTHRKLRLAVVDAFDKIIGIPYRVRRKVVKNWLR